MTETPKIPKKIEVPDDAEIFSCGCAIWNKDGVFYLHACDVDCRVVQIALEESDKQGNKVTYRHARRAAG